MILTISVKHACEKWKGMLKTATATLLFIFVIIRLLVWLGDFNIPERKLRDQIKEKPLRVECFDQIIFGYNNS